MSNRIRITFELIMEAAFDRVISKRLEAASSGALDIAANLRRGNLDIESSVDRALAAIQQARGVQKIKGEYRLLGIPEDDSTVLETPSLKGPAVILPRVEPLVTPSTIEAPAVAVEPFVIPPDSLALKIAKRARRGAPSLDVVRSWHKNEARLRREHPGYSPPRYIDLVWNFMADWRRSVVFEDDAMIAVNKPVGVGAHFSPSSPVGVEEVLRLGIADHLRLGHRLDRETSGLLVAGKTELGLAGLIYQFMEKSKGGGGAMRKFYLALMDGLYESSGAAQVDICLAPTPGPDHRMAVVQGEEAAGRQALSYVLPLAVFSDGGKLKTLAQYEIITGVTHQIRKTAEYLGAPIEGDDLYNDRFNRGQRLMLHSLMMELVNPVSGEPMVLTAGLPKDFRTALGALEVKKVMSKNIKESVLQRLPKSESVLC